MKTVEVTALILFLCLVKTSNATRKAILQPQCATANWWSSFDRQGWSSCNNNQRYITGFYRNKLGKWNRDEIYRLEEAKCCLATPAVYKTQTGVCVNANWWLSLDKRGTWSVCPKGYFLNGLFRTKGNNLHNIEEGRCCKPKHHPLNYGQCYDQDIRHEFDKKGWTLCSRAGYFVAGLYRDTGTDWLHNIDKLRCCQMTTIPPHVPQPTCFNANWWASFDKQGWSTCNNDKVFITGFYRSKLGTWNRDEIYRLEEAKCCHAAAPYTGQATQCLKANWWTSLDKGGTWSNCQQGYFLNGLYRTKGNNLHNIEEGRCCKPQHHPLRYGQCYEQDIRHQFDKAGWTVCSRAGYFVAGLYRDTGTDWLHNIDKLRCCKMTRW